MADCGFWTLLADSGLVADFGFLTLRADFNLQGINRVLLIQLIYSCLLVSMFPPIA